MKGRLILSDPVLFFQMHKIKKAPLKNKGRPPGQMSLAKEWIFEILGE
jgi:hypothetical protein